MDLRSNLLEVALSATSHVVLCCIVTYILNIYIPWAPDLDIYLFIIILLINCAQFFSLDFKPSPALSPTIMVTKSR